MTIQTDISDEDLLPTQTCAANNGTPLSIPAIRGEVTVVPGQAEVAVTFQPDILEEDLFPTQTFAADCTSPSLYQREEPAPAAVSPTEKDGVKRQTGGVSAQPKAKRPKKFTDLCSPPRRVLQEMKGSTTCETAKDRGVFLEVKSHQTPSKLALKPLDRVSESSSYPSGLNTRSSASTRPVLADRDHFYTAQHHRGTVRPSPSATSRILFLGSSLIRSLVSDTGLTKTVFRHNWHVAMWRGGEMRDLETLLIEEKDQGRLMDRDWVVVCGGGNNLSNIQRHRRPPTPEIKHMIRTIQRMCEIIKAVDCEIIFILPTPRCDVPEQLRQQAISLMEPAIAAEGGVSFSVVEEGVENVDRYMRKLQRDEIHINDPHFRNILSQLLCTMGEPIDLFPPKAQPSWQDIQPELAALMDADQRCTSCYGQPPHNQDRCPQLLGLCRECGRRPHLRTQCPVAAAKNRKKRKF